MKKFLLALFLVLPMIAWGQEGIEHLKFMGIPITGSLTEMTDALKAKGLVIQNEVKDIPGFDAIKMHGKFWEYTDADVIVRYNNEFQCVTSVVVSIENAADSCTDLIQSLDKKYGKHNYEKDGYWEKYFWTDEFGAIEIDYVSYPKKKFLMLIYKDYPEAMSDILQEQNRKRMENSDL